MNNDTPQPSKERAPLLAVFGESLAGRVAGLIRAHPPLVHRLMMAPPKAIHVTATYLYFSAGSERPDAEVAEMICNTDPRDLLATALPNCPARLYRAFATAGDRVRTSGFYQRVAAISRSRFGEAFLSGSLHDGRLSFFESLLEMDPLLADIFAKMQDSYHAESAESLVAFLHAHGALTDDDLRLPPRAGLPALVRRLTQALGRISAPNPSFDVPPPYRVVTTSDDLQRLATEFQNCLRLNHWGAARHHFRLITGGGVYLVADEPRLLVALRRVVDGLWILDQMAGPKNAAPPNGTQEHLLKALRANGLRVVTMDPRDALARLHSATKRQRNLADIDLDDAVDDDDGDGNADEIAA